MVKKQMQLQITGERHEFLEGVNTLRKELNENKQKLEETRQRLSEDETALEFSKYIDQIKLETCLKILKRLHSQILPILKEIKNNKHPERVCVLADEAIAKLQMIIPYPDNRYSAMAMLTPMEMRIASMIKDDFTSQEIARLQFISLDTVKSHRGNIRKKLGLKNKQINLASYLKTVFDE
jgi:DNA-binding CsgD family transcriptional regulator